MLSKDGYDLNISNSIWLREGFEADEAFLQKNADAYSAAIRSLDFSSPDAVKAINGWVDEATEGTIEEIVDKIDPDVIMYIINAIYFKADWLTSFSANSTYPKPFMTPSGAVDADFMHNLLSVEMLESGGSRGLLLPYVDPRFAFMAMLPAEGMTPADWISAQSSENFKAMLDARKSSSVELALPKFETRYEDGLKDELETLGMGVAFDSGQADFSLMQTSRERNLYISAVQHKTFIRVDELGTEAAAVTSVEVSVTSMPISDEQMIFDRPFVYGIIDLESGLPIFLGVMNDPTK
jgi:serpin B